MKETAMKANGNDTVKRFAEGTLTYVPLKNIVDHPEIQYRDVDAEAVENLSRNIEEVGLTVPIIVWNGGGERGQTMQMGEGGEKAPASFLVAGAHRRAALRAFQKRNLAAFKEKFPNGIPTIVMGGGVQDVLLAQLRENVTRVEMAPEQVFPVLKRLMRKASKGGCEMSQQEVAKAIGKSKGWVSQMTSIEEELGEEAIEAMKKKEIGLAAARDIAGKVKKDKKAGKEVDAKAELKKAIDKNAKRKAEGKQRAERRLSAGTLYKRYLALPRCPMGEKVAILESTLGYLAGDPDSELPAELASEAEEASDKDDAEE